MRRKKFRIQKSSGAIEDFSSEKLYTSIKRSGLPSNQSQLIADKVSREIGEGSKTRDIYRKTLRLVNQRSHLAAVHYSLKRAIFELGPTGHHFESFVAKYFEELGFKTQTCKVLQGKFVKHEVDIIGHRDGKKVYVECKFHNRIGIKNDIKIALYVKARWDDLREGPDGKDLAAFYLASNTAFSLDAITYANGTHLKLLGVNAPVEKPFIDEIKGLHLYPITSLKYLNKSIKRSLLSRNILLAKELPLHINLLLEMGMEDQQIDLVLSEIELMKESLI